MYRTINKQTSVWFEKLHIENWKCGTV